MPFMVAGGGASGRFVGRDQELEALLAAAAAAAEGRSATVLVEASSGMGATRLVREALARLGEAAADGPSFIVLQGDDLPAWRAAPYAPFRVALERLLAERSTAEGDDILGPGAGLLLPLLPRAAARLGTPPADPAGGERLADRIREAFRGVLVRLASRGPVALVLDDVHALDAASRSLLAFVARTLGERPILLLGSYQSEALGRGHPLRATVEAIASAPRPPHRVALGPLDRASLRTFVAELEGEAPSAPTLLLVAERSGGSPLVAEEVLAARLELTGASLSLPLDQLVVARAARRSPECRRVLRILALSDGPLTPARLRAAADAYDADVGRPAPRSAGVRRGDAGGLGGELAAGVEEAIAHGFAEEVPPDGGAGRGLRIRHELIAAALGADLLPGSRRRMHAALASALDDRAEEAERHWQRAWEPARMLAAATAAASAAEAAGASVDALAHLERAIELVGAPVTAAALEPHEALGLIVRAADACTAAGDAGRAAAFVESALARLPDPADRAARSELLGRLAACRLAGGDREAALAAFERALELLPADRLGERAALLATTAQVRMLDGGFHEAEALATEAVTFAEIAGPSARAWLGHATCTLGAVDGWLGRPDRALARLDAALAIATELGRLDDAFRARANLATTLDLEGRREDAVEVALEGVRAAEAAGLEVVHGNLLRGNAVDFLVSLGRWAEAREMAERALDWAPSGVPFVNAALGLAVVETETSAGDAAVRLLGRLFLELETVPDVQFAVPAYQAAASLALWRGETSDAVRAIDEAWARVRDSGDWPNAARTAAALLAVADARVRAARQRHALGEIAAARAWASDVMRAASRLVEASGVAADAWVRREVDADMATARAFSQRLAGRDDPARWAAVAERWQAVRRPYETARALHHEAEAYLEAGAAAGARREGRDDARRPLHQAAELATALGAIPLLRALGDVADRARIDLPDAARATLAAADAEVSRESRPAAGAGGARRRASPSDQERRTAASFGLSPREQGVLAEIVAGRTNRGIGERLFISEKTVGVHVGSILAKLGVGGRVEAATIAVRLGLVDELAERAKKPAPGGTGSRVGRRGGAA